MENKDAYLIMAHNNEPQLCILLKLLDYDFHDIYLHLDKKHSFNYDRILNSVIKSNVYILDARYDVKWGSYSQIQAEIELIKIASKKGYRYYHLLSGNDLTLKPANSIYNFYSNHLGKEFLHFDSLDISKDIKNRIDKYHFRVDRNQSSFWKFMNKISSFFQILLHRLPKDYHVYKGANWFHITDAFVKYILSQEEFIEKHFKYSITADELLLQTLLMNSSFKENLYYKGFDNDYEAIQYEIDWKRGTPYTYTYSDFDQLINSHKLFARKFNIEVDSKVIESVYEYVRRSTK